MFAHGRTTMMRRVASARVPLLLAAGLAAAACGPAKNRPLEAARQDYLQAASDPTVDEHARAELDEAERKLNKAEHEQKEGNETESKHLARVAETDVERARATAQARAAKDTREQLQKELAELNARVTQQGIVLTLSDVYFEVDSDQLKSTALPHLASLAAFLNSHPDRALAIEGHADSTGTPAYNQDLSARRAESVRMFLAQNGVSPSRVVAKGFGEGFPVASNATAAGRAMNRRVEMLVLNPGEVVQLSSVPLIRSQETTTVTTVR